ncbi:hypothetical protein [Chelativorans sp. Marseille-P2723]|nr:hypothetical protein [Chelativorans sp. Marseille-P2723]
MPASPSDRDGALARSLVRSRRHLGVDGVLVDKEQAIGAEAEFSAGAA